MCLRICVHFLKQQLLITLLQDIAEKLNFVTNFSFVIFVLKIEDVEIYYFINFCESHFFLTLNISKNFSKFILKFYLQTYINLKMKVV